MTDVPTYKAPDGVNGPTLGGYLPEGCDRLGATCVPQNESTWVPWSDNSRERIISESLYWWRLPAFKKGDRVQIFVPPWPGAVLSGLCDEDGEPTWLAQAGDVRGEQARIWHGDVWNLADVWDHRAWVEVRAPRAVPEPERVTVTIPAETAHALLRYIEDGDYDTDYVIDRLADLLIAAMDGDR